MKYCPAFLVAARKSEAFNFRSICSSPKRKVSFWPHIVSIESLLGRTDFWFAVFN